jgi:hypothetical protein
LIFLNFVIVENNVGNETFMQDTLAKDLDVEFAKSMFMRTVLLNCPSVKRKRSSCDDRRALLKLKTEWNRKKKVSIYDGRTNVHMENAMTRYQKLIEKEIMHDEI